MHALIIEDEPITALTIEDCLRSLGYSSVDFAVTEADAVAAALAHCPDLITSDVRLAAGCGIAAVAQIVDGGAIPVVFVTGTGAEVRQQAPGAALVEKRFAPAELARQVRAVTVASPPNPTT